MRMPIIILMLFFCFLGCKEKPQMNLHDGYEAVRYYGDVSFISNPEGGVIVLENVVQATDDEQYIIGLRVEVKSDLKPKESKIKQPYGYFIYDKIKKTGQMGLSKNEFESLLKEMGVKVKL